MPLEWRLPLKHDSRIRVWTLLGKDDAKTIDHVKEFVAEKELELQSSCR
ncbi:MAG: hypothetical protein J7L79_03330 [Thaumarchaeota archaeon]|nr:hypothetical protein [Nitrososphaerota archaeon]